MIRNNFISLNTPVSIYRYLNGEPLKNGISNGIAEYPISVLLLAKNGRFNGKVRHKQEDEQISNVIQVPDVMEVDKEVYDKLYPQCNGIPKALIKTTCVDGFEGIEYDMDLEDQQWMSQLPKELKLTVEKIEEVMQYLETNCVGLVPTLDELDAQSIVGSREAEAIYDHWLNKRLKHKRPLTFELKKEQKHQRGVNNRKRNHEDPYISFRQCPEKMHTRKNRLKDNENYIKMLQLRNDLLETLKDAEASKLARQQEHKILKLELENFETRYRGGNFNYAQLTIVADSSMEHQKQLDVTIELFKEVDFGCYEFRPRVGSKFFEPINNVAAWKDEVSEEPSRNFYKTSKGFIRKRLSRGGRIAYDQRRVDRCDQADEFKMFSIDPCVRCQRLQPPFVFNRSLSSTFTLKTGSKSPRQGDDPQTEVFNEIEVFLEN